MRPDFTALVCVGAHESTGFLELRLDFRRHVILLIPGCSGCCTVQFFTGLKEVILKSWLLGLANRKCGMGTGIGFYDDFTVMLFRADRHSDIG